jgi:SAM-dependent methyltransferase
MDSNSFYAHCFKQHGISSLSVGWKSKSRQRDRFNIFTRYTEFDYKSVLDIGSGLGDFYDHLKRNKKNCRYTGIDSCGVLVNAAQASFPLATFRHTSLDEFDPIHPFDIVVASGTFSFKLRDHLEQFFSNLQTAYRHANSVLMFNFLTEDFPQELKYPCFYYYNPDEVYQLCHRMSPAPIQVAFISDYMKGDCTAVLIK